MISIEEPSRTGGAVDAKFLKRPNELRIAYVPIIILVKLLERELERLCLVCGSSSSTRRILWCEGVRVWSAASGARRNIPTQGFALLMSDCLRLACEHEASKGRRA